MLVISPARAHRCGQAGDGKVGRALLEAVNEGAEPGVGRIFECLIRAVHRQVHGGLDELIWTYRRHTGELARKVRIEPEGRQDVSEILAACSLREQTLPEARELHFGTQRLELGPELLDD